MNSNLTILEKLHTRKLLGMLADGRVRGEIEYFMPGQGDILITTDEIKQVLAKREHVNNKPEGEKKRQEKHKTRKNARNNRFVR